MRNFRRVVRRDTRIEIINRLKITGGEVFYDFSARFRSVRFYLSIYTFITVFIVDIARYG